MRHVKHETEGARLGLHDDLLSEVVVAEPLPDVLPGSVALRDNP